MAENRKSARDQGADPRPEDPRPEADAPETDTPPAAADSDGSEPVAATALERDAETAPPPPDAPEPEDQAAGSDDQALSPPQPGELDPDTGTRVEARDDLGEEGVEARAVDLAEPEDDAAATAALEAGAAPVTPPDPTVTAAETGAGTGPEAGATAPAPPVETVIERRGGFLPLLLGGVLAAALGFVAARSQVIDPLLPPTWRAGVAAADLDQLRTDLQAQAQATENLRDQLAGLALPDIAPLSARLDALTGRIEDQAAEIAANAERIAALGARLDPIDERLGVVEKRPISEGLSDSAIAAYERELAAMQDTLARQRSEVESFIAEARALQDQARDLEAQAKAAEQAAANRAALARLRAELDTGQPFAPLVAELQSGGVEVPPALLAAADKGVVTVAALGAAFPPAAREALAASRAAEAGQGGLRAFLDRHLGARSVTPRPGDDPDAILSRAEAALQAGDLDQALAELQALPEPARAAMEDWTAMAQLRRDALAAAAALAQRLNTN